MSHATSARVTQSSARFRAWVNDNGYTLDDLDWRGVHEPHPATCPEGHAVNLRPSNVTRGQGGCVPCGVVKRSQSKGAAAYEWFKLWASDNGYALNDSVWRGARKPHPAVCSRGHECAPTPTNVKKGEGGCRRCRGMDWDVFYIVQNEETGVVKLGVTSGDPRPRLSTHLRAGYGHVLFLRVGLPDDIAYETERSCLSALNEAGHKPVRGKEYFAPDAVKFLLACNPL